MSKRKSGSKFIHKMFSIDDLQNIPYRGSNDVVQYVDEHIDGIEHCMLVTTYVFKELATGNYYSARYSEAVQDCQWDEWLNVYGDEVQCTKVTPVEVVCTEYRDAIE